MAFGDADLPALFADMGVDVVLQVIGQPATRGLVDRETEGAFDDPGSSRVAGRSVSVLIATGSLPPSAAGATVLVDTIIYRVRSVGPVDDGALTRLEVVNEL